MERTNVKCPRCKYEIWTKKAVGELVDCAKCKKRFELKEGNCIEAV